MNELEQLKHLKNIEDGLAEKLAVCILDMLNGGEVNSDLLDALSTVRNQITDCEASLGIRHFKSLNDWLNS